MWWLQSPWGQDLDTLLGDPIHLQSTPAVIRPATTLVDWYPCHTSCYILLPIIPRTNHTPIFNLLFLLYTNDLELLGHWYAEAGSDQLT